MSEKRYHVYISTSLSDDVKNERLKLQNTLLNLGVFPWEFNERRTSLNTAQARRQIDECDYVIFLLGAKYGDLSASGISYTHLDFIYALNKQKTILSFIDAAPEKRPIDEREENPEILKKFQSFRGQMQQDSQYCYQYSHLLDLERAVRSIFARAIKESPTLGWIRPKNNDVLQNEIVRLRQKVTDLEQHLAKTESEVVMAQQDSTVLEQQKVTVSYRTHAYQDGNFKDLHPHRDVTWLTILQILAPHFSEPVLESTFLQVLNQYLEDTALEDARKELPRAHAVARTQIDTRCLQQIKLQMKWNHWIEPQTEGSLSSKTYWQLTADAKKLLAKQK